SNRSVSWKASLGSITSTGFYTAPVNPGIATITATSIADPTKSGTATVKVTAPPTSAPQIQTLSATPSTVQIGQSAVIQWTVNGASQVELSGVGNVSGNSLKVTPSKTTTYTVTAVNSTGSVSQSVTVLVSEEQPFKMGVVTHFGQNKGNIEANLNLIQQMGASSIRDEVFWASVEHQKGQYAIPANAEQFVTASLARGIKPLLTLDYGNPLYDGGDKPISDAAVEGYAKYAEFVVSHFKGRVSSYEIWNEWNGSVGKTTPGTAETYVRLLKVVYPRLKAIDPNVVVIGGAVAGGGITDGWFNAMLDAGALSAADAISVHQYIFGSTGFNRTPERLLAKIGAIQNTLRSYNNGQDVPLYLTETGWPTTSGGISPNEAGDFNAETMFLV